MRIFEFCAISHKQSSIAYRYFDREIRQNIELRRTLYGTHIYSYYIKRSSINNELVGDEGNRDILFKLQFIFK